MGRQALVVAFGDAGRGSGEAGLRNLTDLDDSKPVVRSVWWRIQAPAVQQIRTSSSIAIDTAVTKPY